MLSRLGKIPKLFCVFKINVIKYFKNNKRIIQNKIEKKKRKCRKIEKEHVKESIFK